MIVSFIHFEFCLLLNSIKFRNYNEKAIIYADGLKIDFVSDVEGSII